MYKNRMDEQSNYFPRTYANAVARQQETHQNPVCVNSNKSDLKPQNFEDSNIRNQKTLSNIIHSNQQIQYTGMYTIGISALQSGYFNCYTLFKIAYFYL